jgi:hypothetical protein
MPQMRALKELGSEKCSEDLCSLAEGPYQDVSCYSGWKINGFRFHTREVEARRKTQNSGVLINGEGLPDGIDFYGVLTRVVELLYAGRRRVTLFDCEWRDIDNHILGYKKDKYGYVSVNTKRRIYENEPFVLAYQAKQIFFVDEIRNPSWQVVVKTVARCIYDVPEIGDNEDNVEPSAYQDEAPDGFGVLNDVDDYNDGVVWRRDEVHGDEVDATVVQEALSRSRGHSEYEDDMEVDTQEDETNDSEDEEDPFIASDGEDDVVVSDEE